MRERGGDARDNKAGVEALVLLLSFHGIAIDPEQIRHQAGGREVGVPEMLRCAKELKLKARAVTTGWDRLAKMALPAIAECKDGSFLILGKVADSRALIQDPALGRREILSRAEFETRWSGRLVLMTRRAALGELTRRFDITWFLQAIHKYRRLLVEVLVASFFL
jgi:subfamily B ATP-binding cassette protein HlyB/CyaB